MIWFSCFCCASENFSLMPACLAESWIDLVFAVRQPLSAPTWAKPSVIASPAAPPAALSPPSSPHPAMASIATVMAVATYLLGTMLLSSLDERGRMLSLTFERSSPCADC